MKELTKKEIERQDFVDNKIFELINELIPNKQKLDWDIEMIGEVRDVISSWVVDRYELCGEQEFYAYLVKG
jgi:hypothetical protein